MSGHESTITVASYNMRKAIGTDRKRNPQRVLQVLEEIGADVVALQEADKRVGTRGAAVPHALIDDHGLYRACDFEVTHTDKLGRLHGQLLDRIPDHPLTAPLRKLDFRNLGWHGNAILVKSHVEVTDVEAIHLPNIEPRGAVMAELAVGSVELRVIGMHLDLSGIRRRSQVLKILDHIEQRHRVMPTVIMGDTNEWRLNGPSLSAFDERFAIADCGPSFHSRKPVAQLDRIIVDRRFAIAEAGVHMSEAARTASDHLPIWARLAVPVT
ncbi:endonuclease/exonuclease/phosphatase family protein [Sphingomonas mesophila]|uniref:endonuclease/exonuclease/phosphatase family protein n=1 Tax=Sphingomonas mesophila TaxID=2303576 RepID=UPI000E57A18D|nr:endonuclease/exonuclease/phosphatase family protein [Sphingomonas mesophila]